LTSVNKQYCKQQFLSTNLQLQLQYFNDGKTDYLENLSFYRN